VRRSSFAQHRTSAELLAVVLLVLSFTAPNTNAAEPLKIKASLSGYNLISPTPRCCAFDLALQESGKVEITIHDRRGGEPRDQSIDLNLTASQIDALLEIIASNEFFSLPASVGDMPTDDDVRRIEVQVGAKTHKVELNGWPVEEQTLRAYDLKKRTQISQAAAVWTAIRGLVSSSQVSLP
jgi:hypothetical protein